MSEGWKKALTAAAWIALPTVVVAGYYAGRYCYKGYLRKKACDLLAKKGYEPSKIGAKVDALNIHQLTVLVAYLNGKCAGSTCAEGEKVLEQVK